ncbi:amidohydrolase, partial [mine drainage metagenome]
PGRDAAPFSATEVGAMVRAVAARGAAVTAHSTSVEGARIAALAGVAAIEHGFRLDHEVVGLMAANQVTLVSTLAVLESWRTFASTTQTHRFNSAEGRSTIAGLRETAHASVLLAHRAGVRIAAGTDFGGGSLRANQLAWEIETLVAAGLSPFDALERRHRQWWSAPWRA